MTENKFTQTPGQRALLDLSIILDDFSGDHPDIIQGWLDKIDAELAAVDAHDALLEALEAVDALDMPYKACRETLTRLGWDETCQPSRFVKGLRRAALALAKGEQ